MYHEANIAKLSHPSILRLLRGEKVRIKSGNAHKIHPPEQAEKLVRNYKKGMGMEVRFSPHQIHIHHHMAPHSKSAKKVGRALMGSALNPAGYGMKEGKGWWGDMAKTALKTIAPYAKDIAKDVAKDLAPKAIDAGADFLGKKLGLGRKKAPAKKVPKKGKGKRGCGWQEDLMSGFETALPYIEKAAPLALALL